MDLQYSHRKYGSLEGKSANRVSFDFDPSLALRRGVGEEEHNGGRRWFAIVVVGVLAAGVMLGLTGAGYRLPKVTRESDSVGSRSSLIDITVAATPKAEGSSSVQLPQPFPKQSHSTPKSTIPSPAEGLSPLSFTAINFYQERDGKPALDYPWLKDVKLIEPHRETTLAVGSPRDQFEYRWKVYGAGGEADELRAEASGLKVVVALSKLDEHIVVLEELDADGGVVRRLEETVMVKYVRREIRTLTDDEREELLDAVSQREKYGAHLLLTYGFSHGRCSARAARFLVWVSVYPIKSLRAP